MIGVQIRGGVRGWAGRWTGELNRWARDKQRNELENGPRVGLGNRIGQGDEIGD